MTIMLLEWVCTASFLILAVLALRAAFGRRVSARLRYALWLVVLVRLLVPVQLFTSPLAGTWVRTEQRVEHNEAELPTAPAVTPPIATAPVEGNPGLPVTNVTPGFVLTPPTLPDAPEPPVAPEAPDLRNPPDWMALLGWAWLAGSGVLTLGLAWANLRFARRLRRVRISLEGTDCPLPVYAAAGLPSPCLFGLFRPAIYVTPEAAADPTMLRHVIAHEYTHFRQGDHLWSVLRCGALAAHWWNPLVWLAVALSRRDGELACDEGALKRLGDGERLAYGNTLLSLVTAKPGPGDLLRFGTTMAGDKKSLKERFTRIAKAPKQWLWAAVVVVLVTALACVVAFGRGSDKSAGKEPFQLPLADLNFTLETSEDGKPFVRIGGQVDGRTVDHTVWYPEGDGFGFGALVDIPDEGEKQGPQLSAEYEFSTGWACVSARWADEEHTSVTVSTAMSATLSSQFNSGYWVFTVELSGDSGTVVFKEHSQGNSNLGEPTLYPASLPDEDAVQAARYAAKLLTAVEDYYKNAAAGRGAELTFDWDGTPTMLVNGTVMDVHPDLNRNGVPETITAGRLCVPEEADEARTSTDDFRWDLGVVVQEDGEVLWHGAASQIHAGENAILLYTKDGQHYLMEFDIHGGMGHGNGRYHLFTLENGEEHTVRENHVEFDYVSVPGTGADVRENFDPEAVAAFVEDADSLLADCVILADTSGDFWPGDDPLRVDLRWLSNYAFGFQWSAQLTTLENLTRFKLAGEAPAYARDLDGDMRQELIQRTIITDEEGSAQGQRVEIWRDDKMIWCDEAYYAHAGYNAVFLCTLDGKDYLLRYHPTMYQGTCTYHYQLFTLSRSGEERMVKENSVEFDTNFWHTEPLYGQFDPDAINAFMTEINDLLAHSVQLINTDSELLATFEKEGRLYDSLWWLDHWESVFTRDPSKSLLENLRAFKEAMSAQSYAKTPQLRTLDEYGRHLQLTYRDKYVQFDGYWDEMYPSEVDFQVRDFNGDGKDEIAFTLNEGRGTGCWVDRLYLFDADTLTQYDTSDLTDRIIARISSTGDDQYFYLSAPGMERVTVPKSVAYFPGEQIEFGNIVYYHIEDGKLTCSLDCGVGTLPEYIGDVLAALSIDRQGKVNPVSYEYEPYQIPADSPAAAANTLYGEVLLGSRSFTLLGEEGGSAGRQVSVSDIPGLFPLGDDGYTAVRRFAVVNLNSNGLPEVVLKVEAAAGDAGGYLVLYQLKGTVYGVKLGYRMFWDLKRDGTFSYSDPTGSEHGVAVVYLGTKDPGGLGKRFYCVLDHETDQYTYYVHRQEATKAEFEAAEAQWAERQDAIWYSFTPADIRNVFP